MSRGMGMGMGLGNDPPWVVVDTLPASGPPDLVLALDTGKVSLWRDVVELNGGMDSMSMLPVYADLRNNDWDLLFCMRDLIPGTTTQWPFFFNIKSGSTKIVRMYVDGPTQKLVVELSTETGDMFDVFVVPIVSVSDGDMHCIALYKRSNLLTMVVDSEYIKHGDITGWSPILTADSMNFLDSATEFTPIQFCNIQQSLNGVLIDNIPCDDPSGTTALRNTATPARTASLNDVTAAGVKAWVPQ